MLRKDNTPMQTIIDLLKSEIVEQENIDIEKIKKYIEVQTKINDNIFELPKSTDLFSDTISDKETYEKLINTLLFLENNPFVELNEEQINRIRSTSVFRECMEKLENETKEYSGKIEEYRKTQEKNKDISYLIESLKNQENTIISDSFLEKIYEVIRKYDISKEKTIIIFKNLMMHINNLSYVQNKTIEVKPKLTEEQLTELFNKYGYDFNKVPKEFQLKLLSKGNLDTIEEMFNCMPNYGIKFSEKNKATLYLILKSSNNALEKMRELSQKYGFDFHDTLKNIPASFIHKSKNTDIKKNINYQSEDEKELIGAFEDFCENIEIINSLGYNIPIAMKKAISVFTKSSSKIKRNIELLREYNFFDGNNLASTGFVLSGLKSSNLQEMIDIFIELDELKYVRDNSSRLVLDTDSYIIRRLYFAKKNGINNYKRQKGDKTILTGIISDEADKSMDIYIDLNSIKHNVFDKLTDREIADYLDRKLRETNDDVDTYQEISILDNNYTRDDYTYDFNGTIISNKKVKKIYPLLLKEYPELDRKKLLLYAITYNSMMSSEEFENISNIIIAKEKKI